LSSSSSIPTVPNGIGGWLEDDSVLFDDISSYIANNTMEGQNNALVIDSSVTSNNMGGRSRYHNTNGLSSSSSISTVRNGIGGWLEDDSVLDLFDNVSSSIANNTMEGQNNAMLHTPVSHLINVDEITTEFCSTSGKDEELTCSICLSELCNDSTPVQMRSCSHLFHRDCIQTWINVRRTCPLCRINV
jgi:hypothetical protein